MTKAGVSFTEGLTDAECSAIEAEGRFRFPPDLRAFLQGALPVSHSFVDWRGTRGPDLVRRFEFPFEGIAFDIEANVFWLPEWGPKPDALVDALAVARAAFDAAPHLIPIYGHRFIPEDPHEAGNPVFSVMQTDIIVYGADLADYLEREFHDFFPHPPREDIADVRVIDFWSRLVEANCEGTG